MNCGTFIELLDSLPAECDAYKIRFTPVNRDRIFDSFVLKSRNDICIECTNDYRCEIYAEAKSYILKSLREELEDVGEFGLHVFVGEWVYDADSNDDWVQVWDIKNMPLYVNKKRKRVDVFLEEYT